MGERTPHLDPTARAALIGLAANHGRGHIIRAILEGVAFSLRDSFSIFAEMKVPVTEIRLGGGGARSALWRQIQADVYGHAVEMLQAEEGAAYGAALLAGVGAGVWATVDEACQRSVRISEHIDPDPVTSALMDRQYKKYRRIYPALRQIHQQFEFIRGFLSREPIGGLMSQNQRTTNTIPGRNTNFLLASGQLATAVAIPSVMPFAPPFRPTTSSRF